MSGPRQLLAEIDDRGEGGSRVPKKNIATSREPQSSIFFTFFWTEQWHREETGLLHLYIPAHHEYTDNENRRHRLDGTQTKLSAPALPPPSTLEVVSPHPYIHAAEARCDRVPVTPVRYIFHTDLLYHTACCEVYVCVPPDSHCAMV